MLSAITISLFAATTWAQGVTQYIAPSGKPPSGCVDSRGGTYEISVNQIGNVRRATGFPPREIGKTLQMTLNKGTLKDNLGRTGYIADNYQFQFDGPPQAGSLYTGGWSFCSNGSLALGPSTIFYQCLSGDFYNLYDRWWADQCRPINIQVHSVSGGSAASNMANSPKGQSGSSQSGSSGSSGNDFVAGGGSSVTGLAGASNTLAFGSKATGSSSASLSNAGASGAKNSSQTLAPTGTATSATDGAATTSSSASKSGSGKSSGTQSAAAKSSNVAHKVDTKAHTVALLIGVLGVALA